MNSSNNKETEIVQNSNDKEVTIKDFVLWITTWFQYLISKWKIIALAAFIGVTIGVINNKIAPKIYTARCNFILDEGNNGGSIGSSGLAFLGIGGQGGSGGLFQGKNLIWLYKSRLMLEQTLLSTVDRAGKPKLYINWFLDIDKQGNKIVEPYRNKLDFADKTITAEESSIMAFAVAKINKDYLQVEKAPDADNIITVKVSATDELFAESFANKVIEEVNDYYVKSKTKKVTEEVAIIQKKVDSFQHQMNSSMYQVASSVDAIPNANPNRQVLAVPTRRKGVDVNISSELFVEMMKNLETKKMTLSSETPLIQVLEKPTLPLDVNTKSVVSSAIYGGILAIVIIVIFLVCRRIYKLALQ